MRRIPMILVGATALTLLTAGPAAAHDPTCTDLDGLDLGIEVHGQHVIRDYVTGGGATDWPPSGGAVGASIRGSGAVVPGGPGPGFHFPAGIAPGASFCTDSNSPGVHLNS